MVKVLLLLGLFAVVGVMAVPVRRYDPLFWRNYIRRNMFLENVERFPLTNTLGMFDSDIVRPPFLPVVDRIMDSYDRIVRPEMLDRIVEPTFDFELGTTVDRRIVDPYFVPKVDVVDERILDVKRRPFVEPIVPTLIEPIVSPLVEPIVPTFPLRRNPIYEGVMPRLFGIW